jgi:light-independent protochlorophyllide reductase subunit B
MKLQYWMYQGPAHLGTLRVASSFKNVHAIMHAPLGDDYFNVMRSMLERERDFTPVTTSIVDRHVLARGSQDKVIENILRKDKEEEPDLILLTPTCTSSILQEDLQNFADRAALESKSDVLLADVNHYRVNELQAADRTLEQVIRFYLEKAHTMDPRLAADQRSREGEAARKVHVGAGESSPHSVPPSPERRAGVLSKTTKPSANILGIFTLGFHHQHDCRELKRLLHEIGVDTHLVLPEGGSVHDIKRLPEAWFNIVPYREIGCMAAQYLEQQYEMPYVSITPMGVLDTSAFLRQIQKILTQVGARATCDEVVACEGPAHPDSLEGTRDTMTMTEGPAPAASPGASPAPRSALATSCAATIQTYIETQTRFVSEASWFSRSIDCQNLTGKRTVVFGDATHAASMTRILAREMGIRVVCAGTYCKHDSDWFREQVQGYCDSVLITDDHTQVGDMIARIEPAAIFGTQMERHTGKRLGIPCGVISAPVHIQNFPLGYRPFVGYEGTNNICDLVYNSFTLGMEDHLLEIFGGHDTKTVLTKGLSTDTNCAWTPEAMKELQKVPGFVRGKVKRSTEKYARENSISLIGVETMYAAKEAATVNV